MAVRVQTDDFDVGLEVRRLTLGRPDIGAVVTFTGLVRAETDGCGVAAVTLEHYPDMTEAELGRTETEARERWALIDSLIIHRVGELKPGDNIVLVVAAAAHRKAAFEAAEFLMDYLKVRAPLWKKETAASGEQRWVSSRTSDDSAFDRWSPERGTIK